MSPKSAKTAHFRDISYNVFNKRKSLYYMMETLYFTILFWMDQFNANKWQDLIIVVYICNIYKILFARIWCYRAYNNIDVCFGLEFLSRKDEKGVIWRWNMQWFSYGMCSCSVQCISLLLSIGLDYALE